jgi:hypothetical protein
MFIAVLFTIAKLWKQCRCPTTEEWMKKMWYIYTIEYYSAINRNEIMLFAVNEHNSRSIYWVKWAKFRRTKFHVFLHMWKLDLKDKCIHKYIHTHIYKHMCINMYICMCI